FFKFVFSFSFLFRRRALDEKERKAKDKFEKSRQICEIACYIVPANGRVGEQKNNEPRISRLALLFKFSYTRAFCTKSLNLISQFKLLIKLIFQFNFAFCVVVSAEESKAGPK